MEIEGRGDLDVLAVALHEGDLVAIRFHHRGVIRKAVVIRLAVGGLQQLDVKGLWRLHQPVLIPRHRNRPYMGTGTPVRSSRSTVFLSPCEVSNGFREQGYFPEAVINFLALLGWNPGTEQEMFTLEELVEQFDISKCSKAGAKFDFQKGIWFNHEYILKKSDDEIAQLFAPIVGGNGVEESLERVTQVVHMMKDRVNFVKELWPLCSFFFIPPTEYDEKTVKKRWKEDSAQVMTELAEVLEGINDFSVEGQEPVVFAWIEKKGYKLGDVMNAFRLALVGIGKGPGMFDISAFLGKEETLRRLRRAIEILK